MELSKAYLHKRADCLDADPMKLNTPAGIVDLATGRILPHDCHAFCSHITAASPGSQGREMWNDFLRTVTCAVQVHSACLTNAKNAENLC